MSSPNVTVLWAGWKTSTLELQRAGWELSVSEDIPTDSIGLAIKHSRLQLYGVGKMIDGFHYRMSDGGYSGGMDTMHNYLEQFLINTQWMSGKLQVHIAGGPYDFDRFQPIDAEPVYEQVEIKNIEDFRLFRPIDTGNEIVVMKKNVPIMLKEILKYQEPKQAELREGKRKEIRKLLRDAPGIEIEHRMKTLKVEDEQVASLIAV